MYYWVYVFHLENDGTLRPYVIGMRTSESEAYTLAFGIKDSEAHVIPLGTRDKVAAVKIIKEEISKLYGVTK